MAWDLRGLFGFLVVDVLHDRLRERVFGFDGGEAEGRLHDALAFVVRELADLHLGPFVEEVEDSFNVLVQGKLELDDGDIALQLRGDLPNGACDDQGFLALLEVARDVPQVADHFRLRKEWVEVAHDDNGVGLYLCSFDVDQGLDRVFDLC